MSRFPSTDLWQIAAECTKWFTLIEAVGKADSELSPTSLVIRSEVRYSYLNQPLTYYNKLRKYNPQYVKMQISPKRERWPYLLHCKDQVYIQDANSQLKEKESKPVFYSYLTAMQLRLP